MGFFRRFVDAMNEEFIVGERNIRRYEADPASLDDILREQRSRGIGSARGLRDFARAQAGEHDDPRQAGLLDRIGQAAFLVGAGVLLAHAWNEREDRDT